MTTYEACAIIEGFDGEAHTDDEMVQAVQTLIDNGDAWRLQGFYGRLAVTFINNGLCTRPDSPALPAHS